LDYKNSTLYAISDDHMNQLLRKHKIKSDNNNLAITRFKGLGEMNPSQLRDTTLSPVSRKLLLLSLDDKSKDLKKLNMMLSKKTAADRKLWLEKKGNLAQTS
jgi:topoisomerase-4 subunit B